MATDNYSEILFNLKVTGIDTFAEALAELRNQISHTNKELAALDKEAKKSGGLNKEQTEEYKRLQTNLANYNAQLRTCKADIKNAEKATAALSAENKKAEGYYNELNESVKSLTKQYKNLSEEELKGAKGKDLLAKLQAQKKELKELDEEMGDYRRNVGNYKSATEGLAETFKKKLSQALEGAGVNTEKLNSSFQKAAGVVAALVVAYKGLEAALRIYGDIANSTQVVGDKWAITVNKARAAVDLFKRSLLTEGLGFFADQLSEVLTATERYTKAMDEAFEIENSIGLIEVKNRGRLLDLELAIRNTTLSIKERNTAYEEWLRLSSETYELREEKALKDYNTIMEHYAVLTGKLSGEVYDVFGNLTEESKKNLATFSKDFEDLLTNYARFTDEEKRQMENYNTYLDALKNPTTATFVNPMTGALFGHSGPDIKEMEKIVAGYSENIKEYAQLLQQYGLSSDEQITEVVNAIKAREEAAIAKIEENQRIILRGEMLRAQTEQAIPVEYAAALELANADEVIEEVNYQISTAIAKGADSSSVGVEIPVPITPIVDSTITLAELMTKHTFGELMGDNLWVQLLGLDDTYYTEEINERLNSYTDQLKEGLTQIGEEAWGAYLGAREEAIDRELEMEKKKNDARAESEKKALEGRLGQGLISQKKYEKELERIDAERATREEALEREAFSRKKRLNVADALMKGALAILDVWKSFAGDPISRGIQLAITAANTGIQVAAIQSQKFAKGGRIIGASHAAGGVKGWISGQNIELEGGEVVINKRSAALFSEQLSAINSYRGYGKKFARGGVLGSEKYMPAPVPAGVGSSGISAADLAQIITSTVDARISTLRVVVAESDITSAQNNAKRAEVAATF